MSSTHDNDSLSDAQADKFELHYRQQLSALVDGELAADQSRFLLRRLERDAELSACQERWQLLGDVLRGQACSPAPVDFSQGVRKAIADDVVSHGQPRLAPHREARGGWKRWGGGAALAASVAAVALFIARGQLPEAAPDAPTVVIASTAQLPAQAAAPDAAGVQAGATAVVPVVAAVAARRVEANRGSATRTRQMARGAVARAADPVRAVAAVPSAAVPASRQDPFGHRADTLQARPWPRSSLPGDVSQGAFNASLPAQEGAAAFYPFEPRPPVQDVPATPEPSLLRR